MKALGDNGMVNDEVMIPIGDKNVDNGSNQNGQKKKLKYVYLYM